MFIHTPVSGNRSEACPTDHGHTYDAPGCVPAGRSTRAEPQRVTIAGVNDDRGARNDISQDLHTDV